MIRRTDPMMTLEVGDLGSEFFAFVGVGNSQEDVLYHVLSLTIITQQDSGQMNHLAIVPAEKMFEYSNVTGGGQ